MHEELEGLLADLADRIAAGDSVDLDALPAELREHPEVQGLLRFARVAQALDRHQSGPVQVMGRDEDAPAMPAQIGPWRVLRLLGRGGMGEVWLGERVDGAVEQRVAIKRVRGASPAFVRRLLAERRILARLSHPNIARFIDAGVDAEGQPWLALEHVEGVELSAWCEQQRPDLGTRLRLFLAICAAVDHAHRLLVVHRDLKPGNVLVDVQGQPHLLDFGVAKLLDEEAGETTLAALTPAWAAPEQLRGEPVSTATDVYALGLLLCRLLSGALPASRARGDLASLVAQLGEEDTQRPSRLARTATELPYAPERLLGDLDAIVAKALRPEPEARYGSAAALAEDIERHLDSRPLRAVAPTRWYRFSRFAKRNRGMLSVATAASLAVLLSLGMALWQANRARMEAERAQAQTVQAEAQAERASSAVQFLLSVFAPADPFARDAASAVDLDEAFRQALTRLDTDFAPESLIALDLTREFGNILGKRGEVEEAAKRLDAGIAIARQRYPESPELALLLLTRGALHSQQGEYAPARAVVEDGVRLLRPRTERYPIELGEGLFLLANLDLVDERMDDAERHAREADALHARALPAGDFRHAVARFNLGMLLRHQRRNAEARPMLEEAVRLAEAARGPDAAGLVYMLDGLRGAAQALGDREAERAAAERMLAVAELHFEGDHPLRADALTEAGNVRLRSGGDPEGERMLREAARIFAVHGHPYEARAWRLLGMSLNMHREWARALSALDEGARACQRIGAGYAECLSAAAERVTSLARLGRGDDALAASVALDALIAAEGTHGPDTGLMADEARAEAFAANGRREEALALFDALNAAYSERYGAEHRIVLTLRERRDEVANTR